MAFSGALQLTDLDDFLAPSQACILPVRQKNKVTDQAEGVNPDTDIHIDAQNNYYEVAISSKPSTAAAAPTLRPTDKAIGGTDSVGVINVQPQGLQGQGQGQGQDKGKQLEKAEISLNDCLACSGCVTSTESMLITLQSHLEVQTYIDTAEDARTGILTISPQTLASLVASYSENAFPSSSASSSSSSGQSLTTTTLLRRIRAFFTLPPNENENGNGGWAGVWDTTFARHLSLMEHVAEFKERRLVGKGKQALASSSSTSSGSALVDGSDRATSTSTSTPLQGGGLPMLASACPGWVCYAEKAHGDLLGFVSHTRSAQGVMGGLVKGWWAKERGMTPKDVYHVTVMPCYDKKLEASRSDFYSELYETRDVDCVLTTGELDLLLRERGFDPFRPVAGEDAAEVSRDASPFPELIQHAGTSSGSYLHTLIDALAREHRNDTRLVTRPVRGSEDHVEYILEDAGTGEIVFKGAKCYGFRNLQNLVRKVGKETGVKATGRGMGASKLSAAVAARRRAGKAKLAAGGLDSGVSSSASSIAEQAEERTLDYVEVMACPGGCVNGGGQMKPKSENAATAARKASERDEEGYKRDWEMDGVETSTPMTQVDEGMRWSTKSWVATVEKVYWTGLPTPPQSPKVNGQEQVPAEQEQDERKIAATDPRMEMADRVGQEILSAIVELAKKSSPDHSADVENTARREFLRTRYRKVEGDVSGLTAKW